MKNFKLSLSISPFAAHSVRVPEPVLDLTSITFVIVSGALADDFRVISDGFSETFNYRLEHLRFLMGCENSGLLRIPDNYIFFDATQLNVFRDDRAFEFKAEKGGALLDLYCRYDGGC